MQNPLKFAGLPQTPDTISAVSWPMFTMWRRYCCLTSFFPIVDTCLSCEETARQSYGMVPRWRFFCVLHFQRAACSTFHTCILNSHKGHTMCGSMVDIQFATGEIRRGKKEERKKKERETTGQKYNVRICPLLLPSSAAFASTRVRRDNDIFNSH